MLQGSVFMHIAPAGATAPHAKPALSTVRRATGCLQDGIVFNIIGS
jgi:hypothetical protein